MDAAFAELDFRYLAGEATAHAHTWSVILQAYAALNRRALPATTPDWKSIDHRRFDTIEANALTTNIRAFWDITSEARIDVETVHGLTTLGAILSHATYATSREGLEIESGEIIILMVEGDLLSRCEIFDDADLDAAIARFEELHRQPRRLENEASRGAQRMEAHLAARDWEASAELFADDYYCDDRRRVVNAGVRHGRAAAIEDMRVAVDVGLFTNVKPTVIATRGERLLLQRVCASGRETDAFQIDFLQVVEFADGRIAALVMFDGDDMCAAFEELDARYLAGEAAAYAGTWSVIAGAYAGFNQHQIPATAPDSVAIEHRPVVRTEAVDLAASIRAVWDLTPNASIYIEAVYRLDERGAVATTVLKGTSLEGLDAEWRMINLFRVEGDVYSHVEVFDEADLDAALARFTELDRRQ
jgi:hypothetical protein